MSLRYPQDIGALADNDFITFTPRPYRSNRNRNAGVAAPPAAGGANAVTLYMPTSTPAVGNQNDWQAIDFPGPLGALRREIGVGITKAAYGEAKTVDDIVSGFKNTLQEGVAVQDASGGLGGAGRQFAMNSLAQVSGASAAQLLALTKGKVYNPNVELLYNSPQMRGFSFAFDFVPKNTTEAGAMNNIIMNFKKWSAPSDIGNGMFEVPYVWDVAYQTRGGENRFMNKFKPAACTAVTVQANSQTDMHVAHNDGVPIATTMQLTFREVEIITREDHERAGGQGF